MKKKKRTSKRASCDHVRKEGEDPWMNGNEKKIALFISFSNKAFNFQGYADFFAKKCIKSSFILDSCCVCVFFSVEI